MVMFEEMLTPLFATTWGRRISLMVLICLSLLVIITLIKIPFVWHNDVVLVNGQGVKTTSIQIDTGSKVDLVAQIPSWHLFGNAVKTEQTTALPITSLQLRLIGIVQSIPENYSRVMISEAGQPGKLLKIGDSFSNVKVNAITRDGVILENGGQLEKLPLQRRELEFQGMPKKLMREE